ncbi:MAG: class I adenylate-forming enzyme family protein, partial [Nevskiales bacterium]
MAGEPPSTLPALLGKVVAERGDHPALIMPGETLSYAELDARSARLARALLAAGIGKGARIALLAPDGVLWLTVFLAALRIGALPTLVSTLSTPAELAHILTHSDCRMLIAARHFLRHDYAQTLEAALPRLAGSKPGAIHLPAAPYLRAVWFDDADSPPWAGSLEALLAGADTVPPALFAAAAAQVAPSDEAVVVYTSGSTAQPKAVVHRHWALACHSPELARMFALKPEDRVMVLLPAFWLAGMSTVLQVLSQSATLVWPGSTDVDEALDLIASAHVTRVNAWGDRQPMLLKRAAERGIDISQIPEFGGIPGGNGKPPVPRMYGMTESFSAHSAHPLDQPLPPSKEGSSGRALNGYERRVVDLESAAVLPPGKVGELQVRGPALMSGLYKQRRADTFTADLFYPTGDVVRIDAEGWLTPEGRLHDRIKTRAANVSRLEVEAALLALPGVEQAVVTGLPDAEAGEIVIAAVVPAEGAELSEGKLRQALRATLSSYKVPRRIAIVGAVPC